MEAFLSVPSSPPPARYLLLPLYLQDNFSLNSPFTAVPRSSGAPAPIGVRVQRACWWELLLHFLISFHPSTSEMLPMHVLSQLANQGRLCLPPLPILLLCPLSSLPHHTSFIYRSAFRTTGDMSSSGTLRGHTTCMEHGSWQARQKRCELSYVHLGYICEGSFLERGRNEETKEDKRRMVDSSGPHFFIVHFQMKWQSSVESIGAVSGMSQQPVQFTAS